jgi:hypothetical protein
VSEGSAIPLLEMAIKGGRDSTLAELAFKALVESSIPCVDTLKQCLSTVETSILDWERFAESLAKQHEFDALELLIRHPSADVRMAVARLFARHGTRKHLSMLEGAIAEEHDQYTRHRMMASLAELEKKGDTASQPVSLAPITPAERLRMRLIGEKALTWRDAPALVELLSHPSRP